MDNQSECLISSAESGDSPSPQRSPTLWPTHTNTGTGRRADGKRGADLESLINGTFTGIPLSPTPRSSHSPAPSITATFPIRSALEVSRTSRVIRSLSEQVLSRMLSAGASPVSRIPAPESDSPAQTSVTSGESVGVFLGTFDPASRCSKTSAACLQASQDFFSTAYVQTWPRFGTLVNGKLYQQAPLAHHTDETEYGCSAGMSWPTASTRDYKGARSPEAQEASGRNSATNNLCDCVELAYPGPPSPAIGPADRESRSTGGSTHEQSLRLNAAWVISLMGFPNGWTEVQNSSCKSHNGMGYCSSKGGQYGKAKTTGRKEELRVLQETDGAEAVRNTARGQVCISPPTILQSPVCGEGTDDNETIAANTDEKSASSCGKPMPGLRQHGESERASHERGQDEQLSGEHPDALYGVSREMALEEREGRTWSASMQSLRAALSKAWHVSEASSAVQEVWRSLADEEKKWVAVHVGSRIFNGLNRNRVQQLKAAGNAIVPEVAASLLLAVLRVYEMEGKTNEEGGR